jgi:C1A family cysteine protease
MLVATIGAAAALGGSRQAFATKAQYDAMEASEIGYSIYRFGWRAQGPVRTPFQPQLFGFQQPPPSVDLRPQMPDVYDQRQIGSCVANALAACIQLVRIKNNAPNNFRPSRLFIYYFGRDLEKSVSTDAGMSIKDGISVIENRGAPSEADWGYDGRAPDSKNQFLPDSHAIVPPRRDILNKALLHKTTAAIPLSPPPNLDQLKGCLADGYPFIFGFTIYKSFFDNNKSPPMPVTEVPVPPDDDTLIGGHAVVAVGYVDDKKVPGGGFFICRNSWGLVDIAERPVQDKGHFHLPYAYTQEVQGAGPSLASDFYTIRAVA